MLPWLGTLPMTMYGGTLLLFIVLWLVQACVGGIRSARPDSQARGDALT